MSHFTKVRTQLFCIDTIRKSIEEMGWSEARGRGFARGFGQQRQPAELVVDLKCGIDIGIVKASEGYEVVADWDFVKRRAGIERDDFVAELTRKYAYHKVLERAQAAGFALVEERSQEDGSVTLRVRRWS